MESSERQAECTYQFQARSWSTPSHASVATAGALRPVDCDIGDLMHAETGDGRGALLMRPQLELQYVSMGDSA